MSGPRRQVTAERLRELLDYDPATGIFTWRVTHWPAVAGSAAGYIDGAGYHRITVDRVNYYAHHLAWFYVTGEWPDDEIDHRNCERDNNRFANLREATSSQNKWNTRIRRDNTSGFKGVNKAAGRWRAQIQHAGRQRHLGYFGTATEAHAAYCAAALERDPEFARLA